MKKDKITIRQIQSPIGRQADQRQTLIGLGLNIKFFIFYYFYH